MVTLTKRRPRGTAEDVDGAIARVRDAIADREAALNGASREYDEGVALRDEHRRRRDIANEPVEEDIAALDARLAELSTGITAQRMDLDEQRRYLSTLERPLIEAQEREALATYQAILAESPELIREDLRALAALLQVRARRLHWYARAREGAADANRLRAGLGLSAVVSPGSLYNNSRVMAPLAALVKAPRRSADLDTWAGRMQAVAEATEAEIKVAWKAESNDRTVAQNDLIAHWPAPRTAKGQ